VNDARWLVVVVLAGCARAPAPALLPATPTERAAAPARDVTLDLGPPCTPPPPGPPSFTDEFIEDTGRPLGVLRGIVTETRDVPVAGVTVVATSRVQRGEQVAISDDNGRFSIDDLEPGTWTVTYYYSEAGFTHDLAIHAGTTTVEHVREFERVRGCPPVASQPQRPAEVW